MGLGSRKKGDFFKRHGLNWPGRQLHGPGWEVRTEALPVPNCGITSASFQVFLRAFSGVRNGMENRTGQAFLGDGWAGGEGSEAPSH